MGGAGGLWLLPRGSWITCSPEEECMLRVVSLMSLRAIIANEIRERVKIAT